MEIDKMLKRVNNLNEYISVSQRVHAMPADTKIHFNMSTVLSLKKVRAFEIEYFNKCEGSGAALLLLQQMVELPPSKTWVLLGRELVSLLQYWLDAMRKHLVKHNHNWWNFLKILLKFIKFIRLKDSSLPNILLEFTAECLLDLATGSEPDIQQRLEILICLNLCCGESSRDIRISLREKLDGYLSKLSIILSSCGHWPTQYSSLENLMRWLVPRHDPTLRQAAAAKWVPERVFGETAFCVFTERAWQNFYQDARDFLNAYNDISDLVVSVLCRKASVGSVVLVSGRERRESWLDINRADSSVSMVVSPKVLESLGQPVEMLETLILPDESIHHVQISKESSEVVVSVEVTQPGRLFPSGVELGGRLTVVVGSAQLQRLDTTLRSIYQQRYELLLDLSKITHTLSPQDNIDKKTAGGCTEEDTRFSHPVEPQRRKHSGYVVRSRYPVAWKSPSSVSTSSLAQLHEKLAQLPRYDFEKEAVHVCALPELSTVTEVSETDDRLSLASATTVRINRPHGVCHKNIRNEKNSQSDGELHTKKKVGRYLSPAAKIDENSTSCLLVATVGSDESVINETIERLSKSKDFQGDNIVDLIVQEALQRDFQSKDKLRDSGINTGDNRKTPEQDMNSEAIENTPIENKQIERKNKQDCEKTCTVISNTTTDESNDVVFDTPLNFVNVRKRQKEKVVVENDVEKRPQFDVQEVENFFTQHLNENQRGEVVISPTLARKINETSSESEHFDECLLNEDVLNIGQLDDAQDVDFVHENRKNTEVDETNIRVNEIQIRDIDIIQCLNSMVDKVCSDLEKCTELLNDNFNLDPLLEEAPSDAPLKDTTNIDKVTTIEMEKPLKNVVTPKKVIKLKYPAKKTVKTRANAKKKNKALELETVSKMSPIVETKNPTDDSSEKEKTPERPISPANNSNYLDVPIIQRRKRKLYSPKDENADQRHNTIVLDEEEDNDFKTTKVRTPNYKATSYKDIEEDRKKRLRKPRSRKSRAKSERTPSPRTKKINDMFDHLKDKIESNDSVILADKKQVQDLAIYNFTSDSEDEDFKKKKIEVNKRLSSTTIASGDSSMSTRHGRNVNRVNYSESKSSVEAKTTVQRPKRTRRKRQTKAQKIKIDKNLQDERMRDAAPNDLNTSIIVEKPSPVPKPSIDQPDLVLVEPPEMETIPEVEVEVHKAPKKTKQSKKADALSLKKLKSTYKQMNYKPLPRETVDDGKESPLPGLLVETLPDKHDDLNDSISVNMLQKLRIIQEGMETSVNETNTTQNLLSDVERINYSPPLMNITEEFDKIENEAVIDIVKDRSSKETSKAPKARNDEIITILEPEEIKRTSNKKYRSKNTTQSPKEKVIEISDVKSDNSIVTVGKSLITAHGDSNEEPPDTTHLTQDYKHRDIEIEDLDQSLKDYFNKLRDEATTVLNTSRESDKSDDTVMITKDIRSNSKGKSPVVSIPRLSIDDISKWLPSRRNSDTDTSYSEKSNDNNRNETRNTSQIEVIEDKRHSLVSKKNKAITNVSEPILVDGIKDSVKSNTRRKNKREVKNKYINKEESDSDVPIKQQHKIKKRSDKILENVLEKYRFENQKEFSSHKEYKTKSEIPSPQESLVQEKTPTKSKQNDASQTRKSIISPIKGFDDMFPTHEVAHESSGEANSSREINISSSKKERKPERMSKKESKKSQNKKEIVEDSSVDSKISTSTRIKLNENRKRKSDSPLEEQYVKKRRLKKTEVILSGSDRSTSSVNEWFRKMAPVDRAESINASLTETIHNVMEKLDTTLSEIHQNTSKKFIHMFVDAQRHLTSVKQERRQMYRSVAADIIADVVKIIDTKFADLDKRSQEMDEEFVKNFKSQALDLIREDCKKKQVMVSLLREDVQAVIDHMGKRNKDNY